MIGLLAGGAALMASGGHGSSGSASDVSTARLPAIQPQVAVTGSTPYAASINGGGIGSGSDTPVVATFTEAAIGNRAASTVLVTQTGLPTVAPAEALLSPSTTQMGLTAQTGLKSQMPPPALTQGITAVNPTALLLGQGLTLPDTGLSASVPSVPEPPASLALMLGSLGLAGLVLRGRRPSRN